jgi:hypothetical protein
LVLPSLRGALAAQLPTIVMSEDERAFQVTTQWITPARNGKDLKKHVISPQGAA